MEKNCFKKYGNENLAKAVVDSIYLDVLGSGIDEKLTYLKCSSTKPYTSENHRKELIKSLFNGLIFNFLNDSQLEDFLLEICNKDDLEQVKVIINERKNNLPKTFMNWLVKRTLSSNKSPNLSVLNEYIKNNESAKNFISAMASDLLRSNINYDSYKPDDIAAIVEAYPWVFNLEVKDLIDKWKFAVEGINKAEKEYASGGYSRIESLKRERSELPNFFILSGYIHKYVTYANGMEAYLISADGYGSAYLYTTKTSYSTTGRFSLYAQIMDDIPYSMKERLRNSGIYYVFAEVEEYYYTKNRNKYNELTNDINRLESAAKEYENVKTKANEALRKVKKNLLNSL